MRNDYDTTRYVKGKRIYRIKDMIPGNLYLFEDHQFGYAFVVRVNGLERSGKSWGIDYTIADAWKYRLNTWDFRLWDYMIERDSHPQFAPTIDIYEAVEPRFTCTFCKCHDLPRSICAGMVRSGQRVGYTCNYARCSQCNTLQRFVVNTGYPTRYELQHPKK